MNRLPVFSLAAVVVVLGAATSGVVSAYTSIIVPSSSSRGDDKRRIGTALKVRTGTYGDIGDNLYDGISVRAQSSTFRPLFNDQVTTPVDTYFSPNAGQPQRQQQQQQRRYANSYNQNYSNTRRRNNGGGNALANLFGRKNNNIINNGYGYRQNGNNGRRLSSSGGSTSSIYSGYSSRGTNRFSNNRNSGIRTPVGGTGARTSRTRTNGGGAFGRPVISNNVASLNPQVARNRGVRLSDVGKVRKIYYM